MPPGIVADRTAAEIVQICASGLETETLRRQVIRRLRAAVPYDAYCCGTIDPLTLLVTSELSEGIPATAFARAAENEYLVADVNKFCVLARSRTKVGILSQATGGMPASSPRYRDLLEPLGFGPELRAAFVDGGRCWGGVTLFRHRDQPDFTPAEARFVSRLAAHIAAGLRAALVREGRPAASPTGPGVVVLDEALQMDAITPEAERWLAELPGSQAPGSAALPGAVYELASQVRALHATNIGPDAPPARLRVRARSGQWLVLHASRLTRPRDPAPRTAIVIEIARPPEIAPLVAQAYGFSPREQDVLERVLSGASTAQTARTLAISSHTVGDYLKTIFDRVGVRSQRELIAHFLGGTDSARGDAPALPYGDIAPRVVFGWRPGSGGKVGRA
ncbi:MAG TPA: helix-turn-helix transcriptional regulator [Actinomycetes bacterium]|nr:helix-turn-helix transcriptional regulator [Actinomycetes bacterium]